MTMSDNYTLSFVWKVYVTSAGGGGEGSSNFYDFSCYERNLMEKHNSQISY